MLVRAVEVAEAQVAEVLAAGLGAPPASATPPEIALPPEVARAAAEARWERPPLAGAGRSPICSGASSRRDRPVRATSSGWWSTCSGLATRKAR
jgi:hypothetical protein